MEEWCRVEAGNGGWPGCQSVRLGFIYVSLERISGSFMLAWKESARMLNQAALLLVSQKKKVKEVSHEWQLVNKQKPIWMRNPDEIR